MSIKVNSLPVVSEALAQPSSLPGYIFTHCKKKTFVEKPESLDVSAERLECKAAVELLARWCWYSA